MAFIYHIAPEPMKGSVLYPLSTLKKKYPSIYKKEIKKYKMRLGTMKRKIIPLNCLLNDVLHFIAVHPSKITKALKEAGILQKS